MDKADSTFKICIFSLSERMRRMQPKVFPLSVVPS